MQAVEAGHLHVEDECIGQGAPDGDERIERVLEGSQIEALRDRTADRCEDSRVLVDHHHLGLAGAERLRDRVAVFPQEIENVQTAEAEVPTWRAEVHDLGLVCPVVDGLQVDVTEASEVARREELLGECSGRRGNCDGRLSIFHVQNLPNHVGTGVNTVSRGVVRKRSSITRPGNIR